jgi:hypothetical protein
MFRHTAAIERLRNRMDLLSLQRFLAREQLQPSQVYLTALSETMCRSGRGGLARMTIPVSDFRRRGLDACREPRYRRRSRRSVARMGESTPRSGHGRSASIQAGHLPP